MKRLAASLLAVVAFLGAHPPKASAKHVRGKNSGYDHWEGCRTHSCDKRVGTRIRVARASNYVERKIDRITPYRCYGQQSVVPCYIITRESRGNWKALNTWTYGVPCWRRACGLYQFLGKNVPWPVVVPSRYQTLKRKLAHHRVARVLWRQQQAGSACHWCSG